MREMQQRSPARTRNGEFMVEDMGVPHVSLPFEDVFKYVCFVLRFNIYFVLFCGLYICIICLQR